MKKTYLFVLLTFLPMLASASSNTSADWVSQLQKCEIIDSVLESCIDISRDSDVTLYRVYYHQPLCHAQPELGTFELRADFVVRNGNDPSLCSNVCYFTGYYIENTTNFATTNFRWKPAAELAHRYHANLLMPEHRYFDFSRPVECWNLLKYCNANEASQDFHALLEALRTVFKGKWAMTGISKGGIVTAIQHSLYPDDADIYVPNCAPFCNTVTDTRCGEYLVTEGMDEDTSQKLNGFIRELVEDNACMEKYCNALAKVSPGTPEEMRKIYYYAIFKRVFNARTHNTSSKICETFTNNQAMKEQILQSGVIAERYPDWAGNESSYLNYLFLCGQSIDATSAWKHLLPENQSKRIEEATNEYTMTEDQWNKNQTMEYYYQSALELGFYSFDFHYLYPDDIQLADSLQKFYSSQKALLYISYPFLETVKYDDHALFDMVEQKTLTATKPIIFLYGKDDPWSGAAMEDKYINDSNVRKYFLDLQTHGVSITSDVSSKRDEIWAVIDNVMNPDITNVRNISTAATHYTPGIYIRNGRIYIQSNGIEYDILGRRTERLNH